MDPLSDPGLRLPVHPHGRGDNARLPVTLMVIGGSPPRAWGQCFRLCSIVSPTRFTPTGVGTITRSQRGTTGHPVHPHGRGDNVGLAGEP